MNTFAARVERIRRYWLATFGRGLAFEYCVGLSVFLLSVLYFVGLFWMVPFSVVKAFKNETV